MKTLAYIKNLSKAGINVSRDFFYLFPSSFQLRKGESENIEHTIQGVKDLHLSEVEKKLGIDVISQRAANRWGYPRSTYYARPRNLSRVYDARRRDHAIVDSFFTKKIKI